MAQGTTITVTVYVTGAPFQVRTNTHQKVEQLVRDALHEAGKRGADPGGWVLRPAAGGDPIEQSSRVGDAGITEGTQLSLDRDEGGGGSLSL